jgi:hypothetical protein
MPIEISQFKLQKLVLEIRYDQAFLLWDRAGSIGAGLRSRFPAIKAKIIQPNQQQFSIDKNLDGGVGLDRAFLQSTFPPHDLEQLKAASELYFSMVLDALKISNLSRIGVLSVYEKRFESRQLAADFILTCQPQLRREGKFFNVEGAKLLDPELFLRWEGDSMGCSVKLYSIEQRIDVEVPDELDDIKPIKASRNLALLEIDYYAHASTSVSKFNSSAIMENWVRVVRRDIGGFFGG